MTDQPPSSATPQSSTGITLQRPTIIGILYLANFVLGFSVIVGVILAYIWRSETEAQDWEKTHFTYHIRTFWIGFAIFMLTFIGYFVFIFGMIAAHEMNGGGSEPPSPAIFIVIFGWIIVWFLSAAWFLARCVLSLVKSSNRQPMPKPETWLF